MNEAEVEDSSVCGRHGGGEANPMPPTSVLPAEVVPSAPDSNSVLSTLCWSVAAILLSFFCLTHLGVMLCFVAGWSVSPLVAPVALLLSLAIGDWLARREGLRGRLRITPPAVALALAVPALFLAASFFDLSWDGLWYQQTAVYQMAHGWNPLRDPMRGFSPGHVEPLLRHYSKVPWYVALALFKTTHNIEWAKAGTWLALAAMFSAVFAAGLDFGMRRRVAAVIAALVSLNPVVVCEAASTLVDGLLISFLACFVAALFRWFRRPGPLVLAVVMASAVLCINTKLTGLVYLCFACAAGGLFVLIKRRDLLWRYAAVQFAALLLGVVVFGYNPYVTNAVHRGNPFFPLLGSAKYPGCDAQKQDPIDRYETPRNMAGRSRFFRLASAIFGRPGSQPFFQGDNARLMWPFDVGWKDFHVFYFHEVRVSGFGPLFSGAFIVSLFLLAAAVVRPRRHMADARWGEAPDEPPSVRNQEAHGDARPTRAGICEKMPGMSRLVLLLFAGAIVASLLISKHTWWARLGPQLWWLPILAVIAGLRIPDWRAARWAASGLAALLLVNAILVAFAHFRWEIEATRATREQLAFLRQQGEIEVKFEYFREPFGERLSAAGVSFRGVRKLRCDQPMELMSVAPGYPGAVRACVHGKSESSQPGTR